MSFWAWLGDGFRWPHRPPTVELTAAGFRLCPRGPTVGWTGVSRVNTFKADVCIYDLICLRFDVGGSPAAVVVHE